MLSHRNTARLKKMTLIFTAFCLLSVSIFSTDVFSVKAFSAETTAGTPRFPGSGLPPAGRGDGYGGDGSL